MIAAGEESAAQRAGHRALTSFLNDRFVATAKRSRSSAFGPLCRSATQSCSAISDRPPLDGQDVRRLGRSRSTTASRSRPRKSLLGETNYWSRQMANGWNSARRAAQAAAIQRWQPWQESTGPRSAEGKARSSRNAYREGKRETMRAYINRLSGLLRQQDRDRRINIDVTQPRW
jgi:hypothetical protein